MEDNESGLLPADDDMLKAVKAEPGLRAIAYGHKLLISEDDAEELLKGLAFAGSIVTRTLSTGRHFYPKPQ